MATPAFQTLPSVSSSESGAREILPKSRRAGRGNVLLADDDPSFVALVERYLTLAGYSVHVAADGNEALLMMRGMEPDVLLADIGMPHIDGLDLANAARKRYPDVQVVIMTGEPTVRSAARAVELGACKYLQKPFERGELIGAVEHALQQRSKAEQHENALGLLRTYEDEQRRSAQLRSAFTEVLSSLWMAYQPIVHAIEGDLFGCEALLRSSDPRMPSPPAVLEAAEELCAVHDLGRVVRARASEPFLPSSSRTVLFVNLHSQDLLDDELFSPDSPLSKMASRVVLEITERAAVGDIDDLVRRTSDLRNMGFRIAIDDLGAGYAAMWTVAMLEPEIVKLDMSLVRNVHENRTKMHIVRHLVAMAHDSGALVVAEGVETERERRALIDLNCDFLQGYLIGRPIQTAPLRWQTGQAG